MTMLGYIYKNDLKQIYKSPTHGNIRREQVVLNNFVKFVEIFHLEFGGKKFMCNGCFTNF